MAEEKVGTITHYYDKIGVAVAKIKKGDLKKGDKIKLVEASGEEFEQEVGSMQIEHADIEIAKAGDEFGIKVAKKVHRNSNLIKIT